MLPPEEWSRLKGTELEALYPLLSPATTRIVVVEDGDSIVGTWAVYPQIHAEGVWVSPKHRRTGSVAKHLLKGMGLALESFHAGGFLTASTTDEVTKLIEGLGGTELPGRHFIVPAPSLGGA